MNDRVKYVIQKKDISPCLVYVDLKDGTVYSEPRGICPWGGKHFPRQDDLEKDGYKFTAYSTTEEEVTDSPLEVQVGGGHYKTWPVQPIEFIQANNIGFVEGCVIKYICRYKDKGGRQDLEKIKHYLDLLIDHHYGD